MKLNFSRHQPCILRSLGRTHQDLANLLHKLLACLFGRHCILQEQILQLYYAQAELQSTPCVVLAGQKVYRRLYNLKQLSLLNLRQNRHLLRITTHSDQVVQARQQACLNELFDCRR